ncbi:MAG: UDP-N-acetylmuramate--L-alanine ligase, partial [Candidatus Yanofskybacteria bacterium CG10_big_fil_rev_8_21_14_0_10_37_15]
MKDIDLNKIKKAYFVGIGGIGVSAIARMMLSEGKIVSGSDTSDSAIIDELRKLGAKIFLEHNADNIADDIDLIVYTPAVDFENPELKKAKKMDIHAISYPEVLGLISKNKYTVAVSGTHGKTTTTAMLAKVAVDAGLDPTVIIGSLFKDSKSNLILPKDNYKVKDKNIFIVEACEYKRSFLNLEPN